MSLSSKKNILIIAMIILTLVALGCSKEVEGVVAMVNDQAISQEIFDEEFQILRESRIRQLGEDALTRIGPDGRTLEIELKQILLETLIVENLIIQDALLNNISVEDQEVDNRIDDLIVSLGGETAFEEFLESNGMSREYFIDFTKNDLLFSKHKNNFISNIIIDKEVAEEYFNENKEDVTILRASHILVVNEEDGIKILEALENGEDFAELALTESMDSRSAIDGGDLGYFTRGEYTAVQEFEKAVFDLEVGEISDLIKTEVGYHIIRLNERKDSFEELEDEIMELLKNQEYTKYIEELENKAEIKVYMDIDS